MVYALREALRLVLEEGLERRFARHRTMSAALLAGLATLGCTPQAQEGRRLSSLNCVTVPPGLDEAGVRKALLSEYGIEIGGGLGPLAGKVWRIGLMGESARLENVLAVLSALELVLARQAGQQRVERLGSAAAAALQAFTAAESTLAALPGSPR
jgi:alanine-glyoxylate transaminase/serine-glyoxylate transaminase/serine-pyruvate transaminase